MEEPFVLTGDADSIARNRRILSKAVSTFEQPDECETTGDVFND
jgi:hypothetical protein